jgi:hypothetical protein
MATITPVNNGDSGSAARTKINANDSALNNELANTFHTNVPSEVSGLAQKMTPSGGDFILIEDSTDSNNKKYVSAANFLGGGSPLTTKGDLFTFTTVDARLPVGTDGQALISLNSEPSGLQWQDIFSSPLTTKGDLMVHNGTTDIRLAIGANGTSPVADSAEASGIRWDSIVAAPGGATTNVQFNNAGALDGDSEFTWDTTGKVMSITGTQIITHAASGSEEQSLRFFTNANGNGNVRSILFDYDAGALPSGQDSGMMIMNIDGTATQAGSAVGGLGVIATAGLGSFYAIGASPNVSPILHFSGVFGDITQGLVNAVDETTDLNNIANTTSVFLADNDTITIGSNAQFGQLSVNLGVNASDPVGLVFEYSTGGTSFSSFDPVDGTNQFRASGTILWTIADLAGWVANTSGNYEIRLTRTADTVVTTPTVRQFQIATTNTFSWDEAGTITALDFNFNFGDIIYSSATNKLTVGAVTLGTATDPSYALGDGDTGLYETSDDNLRIVTGGVDRYEVTSAGHLQTVGIDSASLRYVTATATTPTIVPNVTDPDTGIGWNAANEMSFVAGGVEIARASGGVDDIFTISPSGVGSATGLRFGDGDTGIYENTDDTIHFVFANNAIFRANSAGNFESNLSGNRPKIAFGSDNTDVIPGFIPHRDDNDTGVGSGGDDMISFITGGVNAVKYIEANSHVIVENEMEANITASTTQAQGEQPLTSTYNHVSTGGNQDTVTLPDASKGRVIYVLNDTGSILRVYPALGDDLGQGINVQTTQSAGSHSIYVGYDNTNWIPLNF